VEKGVAIAEVEDQRLDRRPQKLVDGGLVLLFVDRRLVHVDQGVARVVFEHQAGLGHGRSPSLKNRIFCGQNPDPGPATRPALGVGLFWETIVRTILRVNKGGSAGAFEMEMGFGEVRVVHCADT
jgi:hypothetical protein